MLFKHFDWDLTHQVLFFYVLPSHHMNLRDQPWRLEDAHTLVQNWHLELQTFCKSILDVRESISAFVSSRLARKSAANSLFPSGKAMFWWFGPLSKFQHNIKIPIKAARVSRLSFHFLWICKKGLLRRYLSKILFLE